MSCKSVSYRYGLAEGALREEAKALHRQRYQELGLMPEGFQDPYEKDSVYFVATSSVIPGISAVCRLVFQEVRTLPTFACFELFEEERKALTQLVPGTYAELGAYTRQPHAPDVMPGLLAAALQYSSAQGVNLWLCCTDQRLFLRAGTLLGIPFKIVGETKAFYGAPRIPCTVSVAEASERLRARMPQLFQHPSPWNGHDEGELLQSNAA